MSTALSTADIHARLAADLHGWFRRRAPAHLTDDLVQETFLRVHTGLPGLRNPDRVGAWVFQIARNTLADTLRRRPDEVAEDDLPDTILAVDATDPFPDPSAVIASWLPAMIDDLPDTYREALRLTELDGLSQAQLAERLGLSPSGARTRVQRGRKLLLERLEACCLVDRQGADVIGWTRRTDSCARC